MSSLAIGLNRNEREALILGTLRCSLLSIGQLLELIPSFKRPTLKSDLKRLVEKGEIQKKGFKKDVIYFLEGQTIEENIISTKKLNREEREFLILKLLKGREMSIGQLLKSLPDIKRPTLKSDLKRLVESGQLTSSGFKRDVLYVLEDLRKLKKNLRAFTLIEVIIVFALISVVAVSIFVALDPAKRFGDARNARRESDVKSILDAILLHQADNNGNLASGIDSTIRMIGTDGSGCDVACTGTGISSTGQTVDHNFNTAGDFTLSDGSLIEIDVSDNNLVRLVDLGGTYSREKPYVELTTPATLTNPTALGSITDTFGGGNAGTVEYSVKHNGTDKWWNGSSWITNSGELQSGSNYWDANLLSIWHLNEASGTLVDAKGNNNVTNSGATYGATGQLNDAMNFAGDGDALTSNSYTYTFGNEITLAAWFKMTGPGTGSPRILEISKTGDADSHGLLVDSDGSVRAFAECNNDTRVGTSDDPTTYNDGQWHHLVFTYDGSLGRIIVDGVSKDTGSGSCSNLDDGSYLIMGAISDGSGFYSSDQHEFDGLIDEAAVWDVALSTAEVRQLYADQKNDKQSNTESVLDANLASLSVSDGDTISLVSYLNSNSLQAVELDDVDLDWTQEAASGVAAGACLDLSTELASYLPDLPFDPKDGSAGKTYYAVNTFGEGSVKVYACSEEEGADIEHER